MSVLADHEIEFLCKSDSLVSPYHPERLQPASIDLTLGDEFRFYNGVSILDLNNAKSIPSTLIGPDHLDLDEDGMRVTLTPGGFVLGTTVEEVNIPNGLVGRVEGKSSIGRLGLLVHVTAGYIDPGFRGQITLELHNLHSNKAIVLRPGRAICQLSFLKQSSLAARPYGHADLDSKYQDQRGATASRYEG